MAINAISGRVIYDSFNVTATGYVYNENGGNSATSGWVSSKGDHILVQVNVATMVDVPSMQYRIEGKFPTLDRPASIYAESVTSPFTIDKLIEVSEHVKEIRLGVKLGQAVSPSSPCIVYGGVCLAEEA